MALMAIETPDIVRAPRSDVEAAIVALQEIPEASERVLALIVRFQKMLVSGSVEAVEAFDWQKQYGAAVATLEKFGLGGGNLPTLEQIQGAFSVEKKAAISTLLEPKLLLVPNISFAAKVLVIDTSRLAPRKTYVSEGDFGSISDAAKEQATAWQPVVVEGMREMPIAANDDVNSTLGMRIDAAKKHRHPHAGGVDSNQYAVLQMDGLKNGAPVDCQTWTILDEDKALEDNVVPFGGWDDGRVGFGGNRAWCVDDGARFRSSIGGDEITV